MVRDYLHVVAQGLTDEMIAGVREHFRRRAAERDAGLDERRRALHEAARRAADRLAEDPSVTRVVLFGSVATGRADERSDIDLAVFGLAPERYFRASADAVEAAGVEVDLVRVEEAAESLKARIDADGVVLYDAG